MDDQPGWRPTATLSTLSKRAQLLAEIRAYFAAAQVLEVDVPAIGLTGVTDPHIDCPQLVGSPLGFLQSSPEYYLKRVLAAGAGSVYCLGKAFRAGEIGARHHPEFTMLEWYRTGWDEQELIKDVGNLLVAVGATSAKSPVVKYAYARVFERHTGIDPHCASLGVLRELAGDVAHRDCVTESRDTCLELIFSFTIEPQLPRGVVYIYDYPSCQRALAKIAADAEGRRVAKRFEAYIDGVELANGYAELTDPVELRERCVADNRRRLQLRKPSMPLDEKLLAAMTHGMPSCAGVALGVDRLLMKRLGLAHIKEAIPFAEMDGASS